MRWIVIAAVVLILIIYGFIPNKKTYVCSNCHKKFTPKKIQLIFSGRLGTRKMLRCPYCKKTVVMDRDNSNND